MQGVSDRVTQMIKGIEDKDSAPITWMEACTRIKVTIGVRGYTEDITFLYEVDEDRRLQKVRTGSKYQSAKESVVGLRMFIKNLTPLH